MTDQLDKRRRSQPRSGGNIQPTTFQENAAASIFESGRDTGRSRRLRAARQILSLMRPFRVSVVLLLALSLGVVAIELVPPMLQGLLVDRVLKINMPSNSQSQLLLYLLAIVAALLFTRLASTLIAIWKGTVASKAEASRTHHDNAGPSASADLDKPPIEMSEDALQSHVGYYLVDKGRKALEESIGYRPDWKERFARLAARAPLGCYIGAILLVWLLTFAGATAAGWRLGVDLVGHAIGSLFLLALLAGTAAQNRDGSA